MSRLKRNGKAAPPSACVHRYACYCRVSTEDQALAETVKAQIDYLRNRTALEGWPVFDFYVDDGVSGTVPLEERPEGRRLLEDARAGAFQSVLLFRLDRLGRTLKVLMSAHEQLNAVGVSIQSATEPFDTATPWGRAMFQFLGTMSELEKATIGERLTGGRDRVARAGQYTGGPIPFGYDLDEARCYIPSDRLVDGLGITEADIVRQMFERIAYEGSTLYAERARLSALGVPCGKRYPIALRKSKAKPKAEPVVVRTDWAISTVDQILHNELYKGAALLDSVNGAVERPSPGLVPAEVWELVQVKLTMNRKLSSRNSTRDYLLRGLPKCGTCGRTYTGAELKGRPAYRCLGTRDGEPAHTKQPCSGGTISAEALERVVWDAVKDFALRPHEHLAAGQQVIRAQMEDASSQEGERRSLVATLAQQQDQRERVLDLYRRGRITTAECDAQLDKIAAEKRDTQTALDAMSSRAAMASASEAYLAEVGAALALIADELPEIERHPEQRRALIATLAPEMVIEATPLGPAPGQRSGRVMKAYAVRLTLAYQATPEIVSVTDCRNGHYSPPPRLEVIRRLAVA